MIYGTLYAAIRDGKLAEGGCFDTPQLAAAFANPTHSMKPMAPPAEVRRVVIVDADWWDKQYGKDTNAATNNARQA